LSATAEQKKQRSGPHCESGDTHDRREQAQRRRPGEFSHRAQKQQIYDTALGILAEIGMQVLHEEGEAVMLAGGCTRDEAGLVHVRRTWCARLVRRRRRASWSTTAPARR